MTGSVEPSPKPQIRRSIAVGITLRCLPSEGAVGTDEQDRAVERPRGPLDHPDHEMDPMLVRDLAQEVDVGTGHVDRPSRDIAGTSPGPRPTATRPPHRSRRPSDSPTGTPRERRPAPRRRRPPAPSTPRPSRAWPRDRRRPAPPGQPPRGRCATLMPSDRSLASRSSSRFRRWVAQAASGERRSSARFAP